MKRAEKIEAIKDGLEEEIEKEYTKLPPILDLAKIEDYTTIKAFARHFAQWQKEQMTKEAVEGEVCILPGGIAYVKEKNNETLKRHRLDNFKTGDKVRIIIVKEDER